MNYLELAGTIVGIIYLILEYRASYWLWIAGIIMPAIYLFVYWDAGLYADFGINVYYCIASVYGLIVWKRKTAESAVELKMSRMPVRYYFPMLVVFAVLLVGIYYVLKNMTDSNVPWSDSFTTALSIVAMWMLARKYVEQWLIWIVVDLTSTVLYVYKELLFTSVLYLVYAIIAVYGYRKWTQMINDEK